MGLSFLAWVLFSSCALARPIGEEAIPQDSAKTSFETELNQLNFLWGGKTQVGYGTTNTYKYPIFVQTGLAVADLGDLEAKFKGKRTTARVKNGPGEYLLVLDVYSEDCQTCQKRWPWQLARAMSEGWVFSVMNFGEAQLGIATRGSDYEKMADAMSVPPAQKSGLIPSAAKLMWEQSYLFGNQRVLIFGGENEKGPTDLDPEFRAHMGKIGFVEGSNKSDPETSSETFFVNPRGGAYYYETEPGGKFFAYYAE
jgi:hypothetical protein